MLREICNECGSLLVSQYVLGIPIWEIIGIRFVLMDVRLILLWLILNHVNL